MHLNRRINMLIYLNEDRDPAYGGNLELWDRQMTAKVTTVAPLFNRFRLRIENYKKDWLPPVALRALARIKRKKNA